MTKKKLEKEDIDVADAEDAIRKAMEDVTNELVRMQKLYEELGSNLVELVETMKKTTDVCREGFDKMMDAKAKKLLELQKIMGMIKK